MSAELFSAGLKIMGLGLGGVFAVLILFYITTKIMLMISKTPKKKNKSNPVEQ